MPFHTAMEMRIESHHSNVRCRAKAMAKKAEKGDDESSDDDDKGKHGLRVKPQNPTPPAFSASQASGQTHARMQPCVFCTLYFNDAV